MPFHHELVESFIVSLRSRFFVFGVEKKVEITLEVFLFSVFLGVVFGTCACFLKKDFSCGNCSYFFQKNEKKSESETLNARSLL